MIDHLWDGIQAFLYCESVFVVNGTEEVGSFLCSDKVWSSRKTDSEGVESWPGSEGVVVSYESETSWKWMWSHTWISAL